MIKWAILSCNRYVHTKDWSIMANLVEGRTRDEAMFAFGRMQTKTNYDLEIRILAVEELPDE